MLRFLKGTLLIVLLLSTMGCMKSLGLDSGEGSKAKPSETVQQKEGTEAGEDQPEYVFLNQKSLEKGIIEGLDIQTGVTFDEIEERFGKALESDYLDGGKYNLYETEQYRILLFDVDEGKVKHVIIQPKADVKLQKVREILGEANFEGISEKDGTWSFVYYFGSYSFFVDGQTEEANGLVRSFFLKSEG